MKALILNNKVVDLNEHTFDVAPPLHWVDAPNETTIGDLYENGQIKIIRISDEEKAEKQLRWLRKERDKLLRASDWTQYNDVTLDSDKKNAARSFAIREKQLQKNLDSHEQLIGHLKGLGSSSDFKIFTNNCCYKKK